MAVFYSRSQRPGATPAEMDPAMIEYELGKARFGQRILEEIRSQRPGTPGVQPTDPTMDPAMQALLLTQPARRIGRKEIQEAATTLTEYKRGKARLEQRILEDELWWELRHWEAIGKSAGARKIAKCDVCEDGCSRALWLATRAQAPAPTSAWLFNALVNKHADAMDNYPEPVVLPRERSDEQSAKVLSQVLPVILECNGYEDTYSKAWWEKLKHGTAAYGVFWDTELQNGLGDVSVKTIDLLNLYWEPGVQDIQDSRNLFVTELVDIDILQATYPELKDKLKGGDIIETPQYIHDDSVDTSDKALVVDWYYKVKTPGGQTVLQYAKFTGDQLLYSSENDPQYAARGYYDHGMYPVVLDNLFPEKGTPVGFGYVAVCKDPQMYIDRLFGSILDNADEATRRRYMVGGNTGINEQEFLDRDRKLIHVEGSLDEQHVKELAYSPLGSLYVQVAELKINELKETASNRDVTSGGTTSGVTAASAIAALQETGNKTSRDMIRASYRAHVDVCKMVIELIRQFYDETRSFRITGNAPGEYSFVDLSNEAIQDQPMGQGVDGSMLYRHPVFDLKMSAQKRNPFSQMEANERAKELYSMGFFNPEQAQAAIGALTMMDFEGIDKVRDYVSQGQTLLNMLQQYAAILQQLTGVPMGGQAAGGPAGAPQAAGGGGNRATDEVMQARTQQAPYAQRLARRSTPHVGE